MKRVAPTEIQGQYCVRMREAKVCIHDTGTRSDERTCALYKCRLSIKDIEWVGLLPVKCSDCVDALAELGDR